MHNIKIGDVFGYLKVIDIGEDYHWGKCKYKRWICQCECGNKRLVRDSALKSGNTKSCGCSRPQMRGETVVYKIKGTITMCTLNNGIRFIIDTEDLDKIRDFGWSYNAQRNYIFCNSKKLNNVHLSRYLMNCYDDFEVDHVNHDRLDNRKANLRIVTAKQNCANRRLYSHSTTKLKGVSKCKQTGKWRASIAIEGKGTTIGRYETDIAAALAYDDALYKLMGEYAWVNFPHLL